ncbi:Phosphatidylglycerophosphatase A [Desulfovibrionales bacterium]
MPSAPSTAPPPYQIPRPTPKWSRLALASVGFLGLSPILPGSCATLTGVIWHALLWIYTAPTGRWIVMAASMVALAWLNHRLTPWASAHFKCKDPKEFVLDEVIGYLMVPLCFPHLPFWPVAGWGFFLFRALDMIKLPGARWIDRRLDGAWGILLDDLVSGLYTAAAIQLLLFAKVISV